MQRLNRFSSAHMRHLMGLLLTGVLLLAACGPEGSSSGLTVAQPSTETPTVAPAPVTDQEMATAVDGITAVAVELYRTLAGQDTGNVVISPYSVAEGLALPWLGSVGDTQIEMAEVLGYDLPPEVQHRALAMLRRTLTDRDSDQLDLAVANRVYTDDDLQLRDQFLADLSRYYGAGAGVVDYDGDADGAREEINRWVAEQTNDRIDELFPAGSIDELTRLVLANALYLDADWRLPFNVDNTRSARFTPADGPPVQVPMMHFNESIPSAVGDGWAAVELPYADEQLSMVAILPDDLDAFEAALTPALLDEIRHAPAEGGIHLAFPRAEIRFHASLIDPLRQMGMTTALSDQADFSAMTGTSGLTVQSIEHEVYLRIDEAGTEAAAATGTAMAGSHGPTIEFTRPYLILIHDRPTDTILFLGRINDPTG